MSGCLHAFHARAKLAPNSIEARRRGPREVAGETFIRAQWVRSLPAGVGLLLALIFSGVLSCGGEEAPVTPSAPPAATTPPAVEDTVGFGQAETTQDVPFSLNMEQPVPPAFREAYQRRALISVRSEERRVGKECSSRWPQY